MEEYFTRVLIRNFEIDIYLEKTICLKKKTMLYAFNIVTINTDISTL